MRLSAGPYLNCFSKNAPDLTKKKIGKADKPNKAAEDMLRRISQTANCEFPSKVTSCRKIGNLTKLWSGRLCTGQGHNV
jgi:hypothetical protein